MEQSEALSMAIEDVNQEGICVLFKLYFVFSVLVINMQALQNTLDLFSVEHLYICKTEDHGFRS